MLACVLVGLQWLLYRITSGFPFNDLNEGYEIELWVLVTMSLPVWIYFIYSELRKQQTIGKRIFKLKVTNERGAKINSRQALVRTAIRLLPWELTHVILLVPKPWWSVEAPENQYLLYIPNIIMLLYIAVLFANWGGKGIHDLMAKTKVQVCEKR